MFEKFFRLKSAALQKDGQDEAVLLYLDGEDFDRMLHISDKLTQAIETANVGMFDGNEIGGNETVLFMYGPDAEVLFSTIEPVLLNEPSARGARAVIRCGDVGSPQREVVIGSKPNVAQ